MKTGAMINKITENPEKKFRCLTKPMMGEIVGMNGNNIDWYSDGKFNNTYLRIYDILHWDWEEVKEPLSFVEMLKAIKDGAIPYVSLKNETNLVNYQGWELDDMLADLGDCFGGRDIAEILLSSKFYIEE